MTRLATQAKNRLHAILHCYHIQPPERNLFHKDQRNWWLELALSPAQRTSLLCDLDVLDFAQQQVDRIETTLKGLAAEDQRVPLLVQLPGISLINALTLLGAIGDIARFPAPRQLVGYAGLGAQVHDSGQTSRRGRITKAGRKDLRTALIQAAQSAANTHPHWQAELARLQPHLGRNKAIVAIARKLLVSVWFVLSTESPDRFAEDRIVARKLMQYAYVLGKANRPAGQSTAQFVRDHLDRLGLGADLTEIPWGSKKSSLSLPPSRLPQRPANERLPIQD
jgi:transposase